jgi:hypothetical protein
MGRERTFGPSGGTTSAAESSGQCSRDMNDRERESPPPRIYIASETRLFREGLNAMLARQGGVEVVGCGSCFEALQEVGKLIPQLVLLDMAGNGSLAVPRQLRSILPTLRVVAVAVSELAADIIAWSFARLLYCPTLTSRGRKKAVSPYSDARPCRLSAPRRQSVPWQRAVYPANRGPTPARTTREGRVRRTSGPMNANCFGKRTGVGRRSSGQRFGWVRLGSPGNSSNLRRREAARS